MTISIPKVQTLDRLINQLQSNIDQSLRPILQNPLVEGILLKSVSLKSGDNTIQHGLGRTLQGWHLVRLRNAATVYDKQDSNQTPDQSLVLNSSGTVTVDLYVF